MTRMKLRPGGWNRAYERGSLSGSLLIVLGIVIFFVAWFVGGNLALRQAVRSLNREELWGAKTLFEKQREHDKLLLRLLCRVIADSPQLKATVDTPGIDERSIRDILAELRRRTGVEMLAVLTPAARVQAVVGADGLGGADLSGSFQVANQNVLAEETSALWVVGGRVLSVSAVTVRLQDRALGYVVAGNSFGNAALETVYRATGTGVAMLQADRVVAASPLAFMPAFESLVAESTLFEAKDLTADGTRFVASLSEIEGSPASARLRLASLRSTEQSAKHFQWLSRLLFWIPLICAIVLAVGVVLRARKSQ